MAIKIPPEIDDLIFKELKGKYSKGGNVDEAKDTDEFYKIYLGTYFPRSLCESYLIFFDLFSNNTIFDVLNKRKEINILDIGTGTGGNILGICYALKKYGLANTTPINIYTIEQFDRAINYQKRFINKFNEWYNIDVKLFPYQCQFDFPYKTDFENKFRTFLSKFDINFDFDIISSSKFISEFYNRDYNKSQNLYSFFVDFFSKFLNEKGILLLLDLVSKDRHHKHPRYKAEIMSQEINSYLKQNTNFDYVLPLSCAQWNKQCKTQHCYIENIFRIEHSQRKSDISKVTYRVIADKIFSQKILAGIKNFDVFYVSHNQSRPKICKSGVITERTDAFNFPDAFKINHNE